MVFLPFRITHSVMTTLRDSQRLPLRWPRVTATVVFAAVVFSACSQGEKTIVISGDVEGLDSIGLRGARLFEEAERAPTSMDSLRASIEERLGETGASPTIRPPAEPPPAGNPMAERAKARGDSMARASANRLAGIAEGLNSAGGDTIRGIITLIGSDPAKQTVLRTRDGRTTIALSGMVTTGMSQLEGLDLLVRGVRVSPRDIVVASYVVRAADGVPAFDGILNNSDGAWSLTLTEDGSRKRLPSVPSALRERAGQRVWIAMQPGANTVESFGAINRR
jgi:hypothetical protein